MKRTFLLVLLLSFLGSSLLAGPPPMPPKAKHEFTGSAAYSQLRRSGREVVKELNLDLDGDCRPEVLVLAQLEEGMDLTAYRNLGQGNFELLSRSRPLRASELGQLKPLSLGSRPGVFLDVFEDSPDEADHQLLVMVGNKAGLVEAFHSRYRQTHSEEEAGRASRALFDLGHQGLGLTIVEGSSSGQEWPVLVLRHSPKVVLLDKAGSRGVVVAATRQIWVARKSRYKMWNEDLVSYILPMGTRAWIEGRVGVDGKREHTGRDDWKVLGGITGITKGTRVSVKPLNAGVIRAVRIIPGCASSDRMWQKHGRLKSFRLQLDSRPELIIDRSAPEKMDPRLLGFVDLALPERKLAHQTVVFFKSPESVSQLTLVVDETEPGLDGTINACMARVELLESGDKPWDAKLNFDQQD